MVSVLVIFPLERVIQIVNRNTWVQCEPEFGKLRKLLFELHCRSSPCLLLTSFFAAAGSAFNE